MLVIIPPQNGKRSHCVKKNGVSKNLPEPRQGGKEETMVMAPME